MKKLLSLSAVAVAALAFAGAANAQTITSVSLNDSYAAPIFGGVNGYTGTPDNYTAGVQFVDDWNSFNSQIIGGTRSAVPIVLTAANGTLQTSTGAVSTLGFSTTYTNVDNTGASGNNLPGQHAFYLSSGPANDLVLNGGIQNGSTALPLTITGLSLTDTYNVYVYVTGLYFTSSSNIAVGDGLQTFNLGPTNNNGLTSFVQATSTTSGANAPAANYVEFTGVTNLASLAITLTNADGTVGHDTGALTGFQVVDLGGAATPEPSAIWLLSLGLLSVGFFVRRNRAAREI